jgi:hypothetical protein
MNTSGTRVVATLVTVAAMVAACSSAPGAASTAPVDPTPAPAASVAASSGALPVGFPLGSWSTVISAADLQAGGVTSKGEIGENTGTFTMTMSPDGTWTASQVSETPLLRPVFKGTWTANGLDGFTQVTTFPQDYAGDAVDFTWKLESGSLVLKVVNPPDPILPIITESHPWQPAG